MGVAAAVTTAGGRNAVGESVAAAGRNKAGGGALVAVVGRGATAALQQK